MLTDLSRTLREEERRAWQRLVRVLGHEMNNSLAPIKSLAGSLETLLRREPMPAGLERGCRERIEIDRVASRFAEPIHAGLHAPGETSAAAKGRHRSWRAGSAGGEFGTAA